MANNDDATATDTEMATVQPPSMMDYTAAVSQRRALFRRHTSAVAGGGYSLESVLTIPHATQVYAIAAPPCFSHVYTGGADGFIRRYALHATLNGTGIDNPSFANLTMKLGGVPGAAQAQAVAAGTLGADSRVPVLTGYWENEEPGAWADDLLAAPNGGAPSEREAKVRWGPKASAWGQASVVHSLAVQQEELWGLSGTGSGTINLFTIRHDEGQIRHVFRSSSGDLSSGHHPRAPVSVLTLADDEATVLSGGWDNRLLQWDLNTGVAIRSFNAHTGQISSISFRPVVSTEAPAAVGEAPSDAAEPAGRARTDEAAAPGTSPLSSSSSSTGVAAALVTAAAADQPTATDAPLAGADDGGSEADADGEEVDDEALMMDLNTNATLTATVTGSAASTSLIPRGPPPVKAPVLGSASDALPPLSTTSGDVFLSSSINGEVMIWDRRVQEGNGMVRALPKSGAAGGGCWCASAAWSSTGQQILVGRRSALVEIYDIRNVSNTVAPTVQTLRLPRSTGAVTALTALPGGRHVVTASSDAVRMWDLEAVALGQISSQSQEGSKKARGKPPFVVVPGYGGGMASSILVDPRTQYLMTASGSRGWSDSGPSSESVVVYKIEGR